MAYKFNFVGRGGAYYEIGVSKYFHLLRVSNDHPYGGKKCRDSPCVRHSYFAFLGFGRSLEV